MKIKTMKLQEMATKCSYCVGNNQLMPITLLVQIRLQDNVFSLTTYNGTNYAQVFENDVVGDNFCVTLTANHFLNFVNKLSGNEVEFILTDTSFILKTTRGEYQFPISLDEFGNFNVFEDVFNKYNNENAVKSSIHLDVLETVRNVNNLSLNNTSIIDCFSGYYFGNDIITTDNNTLCTVHQKVFESPLMCDINTIDLSRIFDGDIVDLYIFPDNSIIWQTENVKLYSVKFDYLEEFPIDILNKLIYTDDTYFVKLNKSDVLSTLERFLVYSNNFMYDKLNLRVFLSFDNTGLICSDIQRGGTEVIPYTDSVEDVYPYTCKVNLCSLLSQLKSIPTDTFKLWYGLDNAIKITSEDITQIISLSE